jgi:hypothetical protein
MQHPPEVPLGTYGWVIILSWWGATARYLQAIKAKGSSAKLSKTKGANTPTSKPPMAPPTDKAK